jgi:hypothetical protein
MAAFANVFVRMSLAPQILPFPHLVTIQFAFADLLLSQS